jgi:hypothetical protein
MAVRSLLHGQLQHARVLHLGKLLGVWDRGYALVMALVAQAPETPKRAVLMPVRGKTAGNAGKGSKWIGKVRRRRIYARDGHRCVYCIELAERLTLDHLVPRSAGGTHSNENLLTACMGCNRKRGNTPVAAFVASIPGCALRVLAAITSPLPEIR